MIEDSDNHSQASNNTANSGLSSIISGQTTMDDADYILESSDSEGEDLPDYIEPFSEGEFIANESVEIIDKETVGGFLRRSSKGDSTISCEYVDEIDECTKLHINNPSSILTAFWDDFGIALDGFWDIFCWTLA